jgi:hypothetical protein
VPAKETIKPGLLRDAIKNRKKKKKAENKGILQVHNHALEIGYSRRNLHYLVH